MPYDGVVAIDKPEGLTSHDAVSIVKRSLCAAKVGHTGTLDPFATGVLVMGINQGTKLIPFLDKTQKVYRGVIVLGAVSDTFDRTGSIQETGKDVSRISEDDVRRVMSRFVGEIPQRPPLYSAIKVDGVRLYKLARSGEAAERPAARTITIRYFTLVRYCPPRISFEVACSPGTYIRSIAADVGEALGTGAYLEELVRTASGPFTLDAAFSLANFTNLGVSGYGVVTGLREAVADMMEIPINHEEASLVANGGFLHSQKIHEMMSPGLTVKLVHDGKLVALATVLDQHMKANLKPLKVFV
jgi:tRNA pseudouridine55 synthase